jgi:hypothetical protein
LLPQGIAELQTGNVAHKFGKLNRNGPVQTQSLLKGSSLFEGGLQRQHHLDGIPHHSGDHKHNHGDAKNDDHPMPKAFENVAAHIFVVVSCW